MLNAWGQPRVIALATESVLKAFAAAGEMEVRRFGVALSQVLGTVTGEGESQIEELTGLVLALGRDLSPLDAAWRRPWKVSVPAPKRAFLGFGAKKNENEAAMQVSCGRDLIWTARRLAVDAWVAGAKAQRSGDGVSRWLAEEVMPFASVVSAEDWEGRAAQLEQLVKDSFSANAAQREVAAVLRERVPRLTIASRLAMQEIELASQIVGMVMKRVPKYADRLSPENKAACTRDTRLTLRKIAACVAAAGHGAVPESWWMETIGRHLASHTREILVEYRESVERTLAKTFSREEMVLIFDATAKVLPRVEHR
jgi:hypothetical protein